MKIVLGTRPGPTPESVAFTNFAIGFNLNYDSRGGNAYLKLQNEKPACATLRAKHSAMGAKETTYAEEARS